MRGEGSGLELGDAGTGKTKGGKSLIGKGKGREGRRGVGGNFP